jgi:integrase
MAERKVTKFSGVYERKADTKTFKGKPDVAYDITYRSDGKKIWEKVGWLSEGYSATLAAGILSERIRAKRHGDELPHQKKKALTFSALATKYLKWSGERNKNRGKTKAGKEAVTSDDSRYKHHLKDRFDDKRLDEISPFDLERMKSEMGKAGISPKTISHCLGLLRAMYNRASDWNLYEGPNPVKKIKMPVIQNARDRFLSIKEADLLLKELRRNPRYKKEHRDLEDPKLHDITLLSLHSGARASEIFTLKVQDIDFESGLMTLRDTKNTETRYAPMTASVRDMLKRRMPEDDEEPTDPNAYIFTDEDGQKIKEVTNSFQRVVDRLGFNNGVTDRRQKVVFHTCRHSFASWLAIQGTPLYTIAKLMGHKSISMSERYAHLSPDHKKDAINGLETVLNGHGKTAKIKKVKG